jgi:hypothetical protein
VQACHPHAELAHDGDANTGFRLPPVEWRPDSCYFKYLSGISPGRRFRRRRDRRRAARELEALGFLRISLAAAEKVSWTGGFAVAA